MTEKRAYIAGTSDPQPHVVQVYLPDGTRWEDATPEQRAGYGAKILLAWERIYLSNPAYRAAVDARVAERVELEVA